MTGRVEVDTSDVSRGMRQLSRGLDDVTRTVSLSQATRTAGAIRDGVPKRTGRLAASVRVVPDPDGAAVSYGGGVPYAHYIEGRSHAVEHATGSADTQFFQAMVAAAGREVRRL